MNKCIAIIVERVREESVNNKIALGLKFGAFVICAMMAFNGKPPAHAQSSGIPTLNPATVSVVTNEDAQQDLTLARMQEWRSNQEAWNLSQEHSIQQQNDEINKLRSDFDQSHGEQKVWFGILAAMTGGGIFVQLRKKRESTG